MLRIYEFDDVELKKPISEPTKIYDVKITREINGIYEIEFICTCECEKEGVKVDNLIVCEGQIFRIMRIIKSNDDGNMLHVFGSHVYNSDATAIHLQNIPDCIGKKPSYVLSLAFAGTQFRLLSDEEIINLGMVPIDSDGFLIDFFSVDKTTPFEVMNTVIKNCGKGEIYADNYNVALVERIGDDTAVRLTLEENMKNISVEKDMSSLVTRLYPYGYEDIHIGSVNDGIQYIDSINASKFGIREGYKDYSDYKEPKDILNRALWEFDDMNEERIDIPNLNISGELIDLSKISDYDFMKLNLGDRVRIYYDGDIYYERIIKTERYPYEPKMGSVSIGRVKKDLFFYLNQIGELGKKYKRVSTSTGKVAASSISGVVSADGVSVKRSDGTVSVLTDMISMSDSEGMRFRCGISSGEFVFDLYAGGKRAIYADESGVHINADDIKINGENVAVEKQE